MTDDPVLAEQLTYYRRRAAEYDRAAFGDVAAAGRRIAGIVAELGPTGAPGSSTLTSPAARTVTPWLNAPP